MLLRGPLEEAKLGGICSELSVRPGREKKKEPLFLKGFYRSFSSTDSGPGGRPTRQVQTLTLLSPFGPRLVSRFGPTLIDVTDVQQLPTAQRGTIVRRP